MACPERIRMLVSLGKGAKGVCLGLERGALKAGSFNLNLGLAFWVPMPGERIQRQPGLVALDFSPGWHRAFYLLLARRVCHHVRLKPCA